MNPHFAALSLALLASTTACNAQPQAQPTAPVRSEAGLRVVPLTIRADGRAHLFQVEVAATPQEQGQGLMYRQTLAPNAGMIFPFEEPRIASFWMKNTLIPLDMVFIRADGTISSIAANTIPHSLTPVQSSEPVAAVLELAGGRAAELGIEAGDKVSW
ncbi:DUF192 domain-containing protein [Allosphingosinicella flava]|uniref:DUF192 domain-containing protein n=1 Tax=Allosphingosinicella flava TaxID=2771430 RepID=A0A7T2GJZ1_9SPHN|nr:DUF192 domain-containing protein [Sphingosinicella flava]QPQ55172.1 DUF192 domain-containing protein [Sphingosinicella flava]